MSAQRRHIPVVTTSVVVPAATATEVAPTSAHNASWGRFGLSQTRDAPNLGLAWPDVV